MMTQCCGKSGGLLPAGFIRVVIWIGLALPAWTAAMASSQCATVKLEIRQEVALERQAFDAMMRIQNGYSELAISNVVIDVKFRDREGNAVEATSNPANTNALFYIRVDSMSQINAVSNGVVAPGATAEIHWLIIPAQGAGGMDSHGVLYFVGATLQYRLRGALETVDVIPDRIHVRPMPKLTLDYFLPQWVYGDDPWTPEIEEVVPFTLGLRIQNTGAGAASRLRVESAQPQIRDNRQGLLVGFELLRCEVQGVPQANSLLADFGTVPAGEAKIARWAMTASLMGQFTNFTASFTHADHLGGELTSLIESVNTHTLVKDVRVDLPGRDRVLDFLTGGGQMKVFESDRLSPMPVSDMSSQVSLAGSGMAYALSTPVVAGAFYAQQSFPEASDKEVKRAIRSDGKELDLANVWISKTRVNGEHPWEYWLHLFDINGGGTYQIEFERRQVTAEAPPVLAYIGDKVVSEGQELGFLVQASDPNETIPSLTAHGLPANASFEDHGDGSGTFLWQTQAGDYGVYPVKFVASDGALSAWRLARIYVGLPGEELLNGIPESLAGWNVRIKDLMASSASGISTVRWESVEGIPYKTFWSDDPVSAEMTWHELAEDIGIGVDQERPDVMLGQERSRRFYQVVLADDVPGLNGVWGVMRLPVSGASYTLLSPPVRTDRRFDGAMGRALAEGLQGNDGGVGSGADLVYVLQASGQWRTLYLDAGGTWRESGGEASTYELPAGQGLWVKRHDGAPVRLTFSGPVGNDGTQTVQIEPDWNLLGLSEGKDLPLVEALAAVQPTGGASEAAADQLVIRNPDGTWRRLMYVDGWGEPYSGNWFDLSTFEIVPEDETIPPGAAYYYLRRGAAVEVEF